MPRSTGLGPTKCRFILRILQAVMQLVLSAKFIIMQLIQVRPLVTPLLVYLLAPHTREIFVPQVVSSIVGLRQV